MVPAVSIMLAVPKQDVKDCAFFMKVMTQILWDDKDGFFFFFFVFYTSISAYLRQYRYNERAKISMNDFQNTIPSWIQFF